MNALIPLRSAIQASLKWSFLMLILCIIAACIGESFSASPGTIRGVVAVALVVFLLGISVQRPAVTMYLLMIFLPALGLIRRWLIPLAGWASFDPLVVVGPLVVSFIGSYWIYNRFVYCQQGIPDTKLFHLVRILMIIDALEVVNPRQGGLFAGVGGVMFYVIPLLWMILGKQYIDERWMQRMLWTVIVLGALIALYGLKQTFYGFSPFEQAWISSSGYAALIVGKSSRAFSTLTSASEYAQYLAIALVVSWAFFLRGSTMIKFLVIPSIGLLGYALFLESSRGPIVTSVLAVAVMSIVVMKHTSTRILVALIASGGIIVIYTFLGHLASSTNALISHQASGLTHPLNSKDSTASMHFMMLVNGLRRAFTNPLGSGLGATTLAAGKLGSGVTATNSEIDLSNMCISDGLIGGFVYLLIMIRVIVLAVAYNRQKSNLPLSILGVLVVTLGQWSNGGDYSTCAIVWLCIGYLDQATEGWPLNQRNRTGLKNQRHMGGHEKFFKLGYSPGPKGSRTV